MFKGHYFKKRKSFLKFSLYFWNLHKITPISKKKVYFIAQICRKLLTARIVFTWMPKSFCFRTPFQSQGVHGSQTILKFKRQQYHPNFLLIQDKLSQITSALVTSKILGLFGNTTTVDHMYSRRNWEKSPHHVQTSLSQKQQNFADIFIGFFGICTKLWAFWKKKMSLIA